MESVSVPSIQDMEKIICELSDISSAKLIYDQAGNIEEIHVLSNLRRTPKQISRDIQTLLINKYDLRLDHKKISVAQIHTEGNLRPEYRFSIIAIGYCSVDNLIEIKVILKKGDEEYEAMMKGPNTKNNILRLVVQTTLECVHKFLDLQDIFIVEDVQKVLLAKQEVINIAITHIWDNQEELLIGSAILKKDDYEAVVKATLDAINRKILQIAI